MSLNGGSRRITAVVKDGKRKKKSLLEEEMVVSALRMVLNFKHFHSNTLFEHILR